MFGVEWMLGRMTNKTQVCVCVCVSVCVYVHGATQGNFTVYFCTRWIVSQQYVCRYGNLLFFLVVSTLYLEIADK